MTHKVRCWEIQWIVMIGRMNYYLIKTRKQLLWREMIAKLHQLPPYYYIKTQSLNIINYK